MTQPNLAGTEQCRPQDLGVGDWISFWHNGSVVSGYVCGHKDRSAFDVEVQVSASNGARSHSLGSGGEDPTVITHQLNTTQVISRVPLSHFGRKRRMR